MHIKYLITLIILLLLSGCATDIGSEKINLLKPGMTKNQVISILGQPDSLSNNGNIEYMQYRRCVSMCWALDPNLHKTRDFFVLIKDGHAAQFGDKGDFDSTSTPKIRVEKDISVKVKDTQSAKKANTDDMYIELKKLKDLKDSGILTEQEYEVQKKKILERY